jgi:endonuclease/exonuclease/phosphatase family metal-dependent hydrolase
MGRLSILGRVRLATFNVLHGQPMRAGRPAAWTAAPGQPLADAVTALDADVLALQELDRFEDRSGRIDQALVAAEALGARDWRYAAAERGPGPGVSMYSAGEAGQAGKGGPSRGIALLTRRPVLDWRVRRLAPARLPMPLRVAGRPGLVMTSDHPRAALAAVLQGPAGPFTVAAVHLSFVPPWNAAQLIAVRRWIEGLPRPHLLIGDLNLPGRVPSLLLGPGWRDLARAPTYPAHRPLVQLDHVLAAGLGPDAARTAATATATPATGISDHRPLVVEAEL